MQDADTSAAADSDAFTDAFSAPEAAPAAQDGADDGGDDGQPRDEHGRFASRAKAEGKEADDSGEAERPKPGDGEDRDGGHIPAWRLREIREERDRIAAEKAAAEARAAEYERELAEYRREIRQKREAEQAPQRPDPLHDPEAFAEYVESVAGTRAKSMEEQFRDWKVNLTFDQMADQHGEAFDKAVDAFVAASGKGGRKNPALFSSVVDAPNPGKALWRWHRQQAALTEVGDDLDGFLKRKQEEWLKDPEVRRRIYADLEAEARGNKGTERSPEVTGMPSLNKSPGSAGRTAHQDGDLVQAAFGGGRRR